MRSDQQALDWPLDCKFTIFASVWSSRAASCRAQMFDCFWLRGDDYQQLTAETFLSRRFQEYGQEAEQSEPTVAPTHRLLNSFPGLLGIPKSRQQGLEAKSKKNKQKTNKPKPGSQRVLKARVHDLAWPEYLSTQKSGPGLNLCQNI